MEASQNGVPGDRAAPFVRLESKFDIVPAPILLQATKVNTAWDYGPKYRNATQDPVQVLPKCFSKFSLNMHNPM